MKKILTILTALLVLVGCSKTETTSTKTDEKTETVSVYNGNYIDLLGSDKKSEIYNLRLDLSDDEVALLGTTLPDISFTTYEGETVSLPSSGGYVFEILGSWCTYCQALVNETHDLYASLGVPVYQYFLSGSASDIDDFYNDIGIERVQSATQLTYNDTMEQWISSHNLYSVPMIIVVDESGTIAMTHVGYLPADDFSAYLDYALSAKLYDVEIDGETLPEYIEKQVVIHNYIDNLTEIEVPSAIFETAKVTTESGPVVSNPDADGEVIDEDYTVDENADNTVSEEDTAE